jgi:hypothetical protein
MGTTWTSLVLRLAARAALRPRLGVDLVRTAWVFRRRGWHRRPPFLPLPDATYLRWRMSTAYADEHAVPSAEDVVRFARWRRETMGL